MTETTLSLPSSPRRFGFFVAGEQRESGDRKILTRCSPAHDVAVSCIPCCNEADLDAAVAAARQAFDRGDWSQCNAAERADVLLRAAGLIRQQQEPLAFYETLETGKPITQARAEVAAAAGIFDYAAGVARTLHGDSFNNLGSQMLGLVTREPIGVVGVITPWNFPFFILCERLPFILAAGCTIVAKPSEVTSATTLMLADILHQAGLPAGVFNVVTGSGAVVGQAMTEHAAIDMLSFTGSTRVGRSALLAAGGNFKRLALELGGKNPQIVYADAELDDAADGVAFGLCFNAGQCCVSGSRLVVERSVADVFAGLLKDKLAAIRIGDPLDVETQVGAITTAAQNRSILDYIAQGERQGARLICGGKALDRGAGQFIAPTLFSNMQRDMEIARAEIFGPVLGIFPFADRDEAIDIANDSEYGLAASIWSKNIDHALLTARRVQAGRVWVNCTITGGPELPIGGFKQSGWGRETGVYGVEEYTQIKSVHIELGRRKHWLP